MIRINLNELSVRMVQSCFIAGKKLLSAMADKTFPASFSGIFHSRVSRAWMRCDGDRILMGKKPNSSSHRPELEAAPPIEVRKWESDQHFSVEQPIAVTREVLYYRT